MAIAALIISFLVACAVIYREFLHNQIFNPNLQIEFSLNDPISWETLLINGKKGFWLRLRVTNNGRSATRRCEGILAEVRLIFYQLLPGKEGLVEGIGMFEYIPLFIHPVE